MDSGLDGKLKRDVIAEEKLGTTRSRTIRTSAGAFSCAPSADAHSGLPRAQRLPRSGGNAVGGLLCGPIAHAGVACAQHKTHPRTGSTTGLCGW
jgi:hypothetical protein